MACLVRWLIVWAFFFFSQRGMLAQLAARLRARPGGGEGGAGGGVVVGEDGEAIVLDENCTVCVESKNLDTGWPMAKHLHR